MPRFSRNLMIAQSVVFLATQVAMVWLGVPVLGYLGVGGDAPFGFAWQWLTHPFVELPSTLLPFALAMLVAYLVYPRIEQLHGRAGLVAALATSAIAGGVFGSAVSFLLPPPIPVGGAIGPVIGLLAYESWARRHAGPARVTLFGVGAGVDLTGKQIVGGLFAYSVLMLLLSRDFVRFAMDVGCLLGGMLAVHLRQRWAFRARPSGLRVVRGGKPDRDRMLH